MTVTMSTWGTNCQSVAHTSHGQPLYKLWSL